MAQSTSSVAKMHVHLSGDTSPETVYRKVCPLGGHIDRYFQSYKTRQKHLFEWGESYKLKTESNTNRFEITDKI